MGAKGGKCVSQILRFFQDHEPGPFDPKEVMAPLPGPTLRAKLGDIVELTFLNQINPQHFAKSFVLDQCDSTTGAGAYPKVAGDTMPSCFHGSITGNIHFHGTHTSPISTGDNVFLQVTPSPNGQPTVTAASVQKDFDAFFAECEEKLKNPLEQWPMLWKDLPKHYTDQQQALLPADLWNKDKEQIAAGKWGWPQYYVGAFPYCFALPKYPDAGPPALRMGQAPGTHWYHAHKHGSTYLNVANGMLGAFIIEGDEYDGKLNAFYDKYRTNTESEWTASSRPWWSTNLAKLRTSSAVPLSPPAPRRHSQSTASNSRR